MIKSIQNQKKSLITLHDDIATFKAEYDADKEISPENLACPHVSLSNLLGQTEFKSIVWYRKESQNSSWQISSSGSGVGAL